MEELVTSIFRVDKEDIVAGRTSYIISGKSRIGKETKRTNKKRGGLGWVELCGKPVRGMESSMKYGESEEIEDIRGKESHLIDKLRKLKRENQLREVMEPRTVGKCKGFNKFFKNCFVYEITWKNMVESKRPQMTLWCIHVVCWITKATDTHSEYVVLIAFSMVAQTHPNITLTHTFPVLFM